MQFCLEALESTKISSYEPVSSQKYENGYRTKIYNFTVPDDPSWPEQVYVKILMYQGIEVVVLCVRVCVRACVCVCVCVCAGDYSSHLP